MGWFRRRRVRTPGWAATGLPEARAAAAPGALPGDGPPYYIYEEGGATRVAPRGSAEYARIAEAIRAMRR